MIQPVGKPKDASISGSALPFLPDRPVLSLKDPGKHLFLLCRRQDRDPVQTVKIQEPSHFFQGLPSCFLGGAFRIPAVFKLLGQLLA